MNIDTAFPSKYVRADDLNNRDIRLTITSINQEDVENDGSTKPVLYFNGTAKGLVLNKTNAHTIADMLGTETDNWLGHSITLFPTKTDFGGKRVDCIRVRETAVLAPSAQPAVAPAALATATAPPSDTEITF